MKSEDAIEVAVKQAVDFINHADLRAYFKNGNSLFAPQVRTDSGGFYLIGDEAFETLKPLLSIVISENKWERMISPSDVVEKMLELFGDVLFKRVNDVDTEGAFLSALKARIEDEFKSYTVYVPCNITYTDCKPIELLIGPVRLLNRAAFKLFIERNRNQLKHFKHQELWDECESHYDKFQWVSEVKIPRVYEYDIAKELAEKASINALNLLHLLISITHSYRMETGFNISPTNDSYQVYRYHDGKFGYQLSGSASGNVGIPDDFWNMFEEGYFKTLLTIHSEAINLSLELKESYPAVERYLQASYWLGDAIRESSPAIQVVKYVTCLERLLTFNESSAIKKKVSKRSTALLICSGFVGNSSAGNVYYEFKQLYQLRSDVVHGSLSPNADKLPMSLIRIDELTREVVMSFMNLVGARLHENDTELRLSSWLKQLVRDTGLAALDEETG